MNYSKQNGTWRVAIWSTHRSGVKIEDHGNVNDGEFDAIVESSVRRPIVIDRDDLFQMSVLKFGKRGDILLIRAHHSIADGHSLLIIAEEFIKLLIQMPIFGPKPMSHCTYLNSFENVSPQRQAEIDDYWHGILFPILPKPSTGNFGTGKEFPFSNFNIAAQGKLDLALNEQEWEKVTHRARQLSVTLYAILFATYCDTLLELSSLPGIYVETSIDRTASKLANYVGCLASSIVVRCERKDGKNAAELAPVISQQIRYSMAHLPSEAAYLLLKHDQEVYAAGGLLRHFKCAVSLPKQRAERSPFAKGMLAAAGTSDKLGPYRLTKLNIKSQLGTPKGLAMRNSPQGEIDSYSLLYNQDYYTGKDIKTFSEVFFKRLFLA